MRQRRTTSETLVCRRTRRADNEHRCLRGCWRHPSPVPSGHSVVVLDPRHKAGTVYRPGAEVRFLSVSASDTLPFRTCSPAGLFLWPRSSG